MANVLTDQLSFETEEIKSQTVRDGFLGILTCVLDQFLDRDDQIEIAKQIADFNPDVLIGGGLMFFLPQNTEGSERQDSNDLVKQMSSTRQIAYSYDELMKTEGSSGLAGLIAMEQSCGAISSISRRGRLRDSRRMCLPSL